VTCRATIIIPSFNGRSHLETCLRSLFAGEDLNGGSEVLVVDNGSTDGTREWLATTHPRARLVPLAENGGFTGAIAAGCDAADPDSDFLVFLNNDTRVESGWLVALVEALATAPPETATVSGRILSWDGERIDFYRGAMAFDGHAFQLDFHRPLAAVAAAGEAAEVPFPCGGNMAVRREAWDSLGGFDDDYFAYTEDVDFGWRSWLAGYDHRYEPGATVYHRSGATGLTLGVYRRGYLYEKNAFMTAYKNLDEERFRALMPAILWTLIHRALTLITDSNMDGAKLGGYPLPPYARPGSAAPPAEGLGARLRRHGLRGAARRALLKLARRLGEGGSASERVILHDARTLEHLRAVHFLVHHLDDLAAKRERVQTLRRRGDDEYFARFPLLLVPTYPGDDDLFASRGFEEWLPRELALLRRSLDEIGDLR